MSRAPSRRLAVALGRRLGNRRPRGLDLTEHTLERIPDHEYMDLYTPHVIQDIGLSGLEGRLPSQYVWPKRFFHKLRNIVVHSPTGLIFHEEKAVRQSGQLYLSARDVAALQMVVNPATKSLGHHRNSRPFLVIPPIPAYYHWVSEWLPQFLRLKALGVEVVAFTHEHQPNYVLESLEMMGVELIAEKREWSRLDSVILVDKPNTLFKHPDEVELVRNFAQTVARGFTGHESWPSKIYVSRRGTSREIAKESELESWLESEGFLTFRPEVTSSFEQQIVLFARCDVMVLPSGSGYANAQFMKAGTRVINLFSPRFDCLDLTAHSAALSQRFERVDLPHHAEAPYGSANDAKEALQKLLPFGSDDDSLP